MSFEDMRLRIFIIYTRYYKQDRLDFWEDILFILYLSFPLLHCFSLCICVTGIERLVSSLCVSKFIGLTYFSAKFHPNFIPFHCTNLCIFREILYKSSLLILVWQEEKEGERERIRFT